MDKITITLDGKEYQLDIQKGKELGILEEKDSRCKSWEEFYEKYSTKEGYFHNDLFQHISFESVRSSNTLTMTCTQLTKEEAIAISAFSKLLKLRRDWIGDWEPDWSFLKGNRKYCIISRNNRIIICPFDDEDVQETFSFPTEEMAREFLECFKDLFLQCKILI